MMWSFGEPISPASVFFFFLNIHCSSGYLLLLPSCCSNNHSTVVSHWGHIFFPPILMFGLNTYLFWPCLHGLYALSGLLDIVHQCAGLPNNEATGWSLFFSFGHQFCFPTKLKSFKREPKLEEKTELRQNMNGFRHQNDQEGCCGAPVQISRNGVADKELASLFLYWSVYSGNKRFINASIMSVTLVHFVKAPFNIWYQVCISCSLSKP